MTDFSASCYGVEANASETSGLYQLLPERHLVNAQGEAWGQGVILLTWSQVASVEETTGLFLSVLGCWKASYEKIPAWALYLLCFPQKVDGMQATRLEHIYIYKAPQLGAYREVEEQCT